MMRRGGESGFAVFLRLVVVLGVAGAGAPARAADKPPAFKPAWSVEAKYELQRISIGAAGKVVYARDGKKLTGLNTADGSKKWQIELPGFDEKGFWGPLESTTYVYSTSKDVVGIDIDAGTERWRVAPAGIRTDAYLHPRMGHPNALMIAFERGTTIWEIAKGKLLWSATERPSEDMVPSVWARDDDPKTGILVFLSKRTVFIDTTGKEAWSAAEPGNERRGGKDVLKSAVVDYGRLLVVYLAKQVVVLNNVTGEVIASQAFPSDEAAADVEVFRLGDDAPVLVTLGGRLTVVDPRDGTVLSRTPENSILGQAAGGVMAGTDIIAMTNVRGGEKTPNAGMHLYRIDPASGAVKWHAYNGAMIDTRQVMANVIGERINGPFFLDKAKGILLATSDKGVRLYNLEDGKERWAVDQDLPHSYRVMSVFGTNSFAVIRSMMQNRIYVPTNPPPVEGDGVVYVASSDEVFALDAASGKINWTSKSKNLSLVAGLSLSGSTVMVRQGMYADANDYGAPTTVVTQFAGRTWVEEPEVYIEEDPYGYVGLDAATGKETWNALDFEPHDIAMSGPMPTDIVVREVSKAKKEKGCRLGKLGVGGIVMSYPLPNGVMYVGKGGIAAAPANSCAATWSVDGSIKKMEKVYELTEHGEDYSFGMVQHDNPPYLISHYGNEASVVDLAAGKVILSVGDAQAVKVDWANKRLFVAEGNNMSMYVLP